MNGSPIPPAARLALALLPVLIPLDPTAIARAEPALLTAPQTASLGVLFPSVTGPFHWLDDGAIQAQTNWPDPTTTPSTRPQPNAVSVRYHFGLPAQPPDRRWREDDQLPIHHAVWEHQNIRYTQILLLSRIQPGDLMPDGTLPEDTVILIQLTGMSLATEYTDAVASLQVDVDGQPFELALDRGLVRASTNDPPLLLAALDVPAEGVDTSSGPRLRFRGHMPPGTSGAMTIKIPLRPLDGTDSLNRLHDLEFDDEFRRVRRYWQSRIRVDPQTPPPAFFHVTGVSVRGNVQPHDTRPGD